MASRQLITQRCCTIDGVGSIGRRSNPLLNWMPPPYATSHERALWAEAHPFRSSLFASVGSAALLAPLLLVQTGGSEIGVRVIYSASRRCGSPCSSHYTSVVAGVASDFGSDGISTATK